LSTSSIALLLPPIGAASSMREPGAGVDAYCAWLTVMLPLMRSQLRSALGTSTRRPSLHTIMRTASLQLFSVMFSACAARVLWVVAAVKVSWHRPPLGKGTAVLQEFSAKSKLN